MSYFRLANVVAFPGAVLLVFLSQAHLARAQDVRGRPASRMVCRANKPETLLEEDAPGSHIESGKYCQVRLKPAVKVASHDFFTRYGKAFGLQKEDEFRSVLTKTNPLFLAEPRKLVRYQQHYKGLPVIGLEYVLQTDAADHVLAASGKHVSRLEVDTNPSIPEAAALETAKGAVPAQIYSWEKETGPVPKGTLAISFKGMKLHRKNARLVYRFTIASEQPAQSYVVEVDAHSGEVLNKMSNRVPDVVDWNVTIANCQLAGLQATTVQVPCDQGVDGKFRLMCLPGPIAKCGAPLKMIDARRPNPQAQGGADPNQDYVFADEDNQNPPIFGEKTVPGESDDVIGEYFYVSMLYTLKFYYQYFGWAGLDGLGQIPILCYVKPFTDPPNAAAYYDETSHSITFDPNKTQMFYTNGAPNYYGVISAGHEFTHGVLRELIPGEVYAGEMASLDESFADIMGISGVYFGACYGQTGGLSDFKTCLATHLGYPEEMSDPQSGDLPTTYKGYFYAGSEGCNGSDTCYQTPQTTVPCDSSNFNCDPDHRNAKVQNYMFYLLTAGGGGINDPPLNHPYNVEGIGPYEAGRIAFQTMQVRLLPASTYPEARDAWIAAAQDLYGADSSEVRAVTLAWYAVGIGDISDLDVPHSPENGSENVPPWPATLQWQDQPDETAWQAQISTSPNFDQDLQTSNAAIAILPPVQNTYSAVTFNLKPDTNYYWHVRALRKPSSPGKRGGSSGDDLQTGLQPSQGPTVITPWGDWSLLRNFKTDTRASTLVSPVEVSPKVYPWNGEFKWDSVEGGRKYWLDTSEEEDLGLGSNLGPSKVVLGAPQNIGPNNPLQTISLSDVLFDLSDPGNTGGGNLIKHMVPFPLKVNHTYYWSILPYGPDDIQGTWSNDQKGQIFETSTPQTKLAAPEDDTTVSPWGIDLQWEATRGAVGYILQVSRQPDMSDNIYTGPDPGGTSQVISLPDAVEQPGYSIVPQAVIINPVAQLLHRDYYWAVTPKGPSPYYEKGRASDIWGFNIDHQATKPVLISPSDGSHIPYRQPSLQFTWQPVEHATEYLFTLYNRNADGSRGAPVIDSRSVPTSQESNGEAYIELNNEGVTNQPGYCWQVQAIGPKDLQGNSLQGPPSDIFCYSLSPDKPILVNPPDGASDVEYSPLTFTWASEWAPGGYALDFGAIDSNGLCQAAPVTPSGKSYTVDLQPGTKYCWQVTALGSTSEEFTHSTIEYFSTKSCNLPPAPAPINPPKGEFDCGSSTSNLYQVTFQWSAVPDATQYELTVEWAPNAGSGDWTTKHSLVSAQYINGTTWGPITVSKNDYYTWEIRSKNSCGWGPWISYYFICYQ